MLMEDERLLRSDDKRLMEKVAAALDAKYSKRFYSILEQAKSLYDIMDPDKDTHQTQVPSRKQILDGEYDLLQKVDKLLDKANFFEIPREQLLPLLQDRDTSGIVVSIDTSQYELLRMWTRGWEAKRKSPSIRLKDYVWSLVKRTAGPGPTTMGYTRVFLAVRCKGEKKLHLKVFKDILATELEHLLPRGKLKMSPFDKGMLASGVLFGVCLPLLRLLPSVSDLTVKGGALVAVFVAGRAWTNYKNKRNHYLANLAKTLYFKTVANNRGVLTLLTDRAQDEEFKEALLAYVFLLCPARDRSVDLAIYDTADSLKSRIEAWLVGQIQVKDFSFDVADALDKLEDLGLLVRRRNGTLTALAVPDALSLLPAPSERWLAVGMRRDTQSMDEEMGGGKGHRTGKHR